MYEFRPPDVPAAVARPGGTLNVWASEIEKKKDDMAGQIPGLARDAVFDMAGWPDLTSTPVKPKADEGHPAQAAAKAVLLGRTELAGVIASFRDRVRRVVDGPPEPTTLDDMS